jgi:hypothetical protein
VASRQERLQAIPPKNIRLDLLPVGRGWKGNAEVTTYTASVEQEALAGGTMERVFTCCGDPDTA